MRGPGQRLPKNRKAAKLYVLFCLSMVKWKADKNFERRERNENNKWKSENNKKDGRNGHREGNFKIALRNRLEDI